MFISSINYEHILPIRQIASLGSVVDINLHLNRIDREFEPQLRTVIIRL